MLVATNQPLSRRCSNIWRASCAAALIILLMLTSGSLGVRRAHAQAVNPFDGVADKKNAEEQAIAAERNDEANKLRAEQDQLKMQLDLLQLEKEKLQLQLEKTRSVLNKQAADQGGNTIEERMKDKRLKEFPGDQIAIDKAKATKDKEIDELVMRGKFAAARQKARENDALDVSSRPQLDLVSLANSYVDAVGNLQLTEIELERLSDRQGAFSKAEIAMAKVKVQTAQRKVQIFRSIAEAAIEAAKMDFEQASQLVDQGLAPKNSVSEAKSRLRILQVILQ